MNECAHNIGVALDLPDISQSLACDVVLRLLLEQLLPLRCRIPKLFLLLQEAASEGVAIVSFLARATRLAV